jgi:hypothetical protein
MVELAPPSEERTRPATINQSHRLSRTGQISLGLTMALLAFLLYRYSFASNQQLIKRFQFCRPLQSAQLVQSEVEQQSLNLINNLTSATASQKLRLREQYKFLLLESNRLCGLDSFYRSQEAALMTVATSALCLLSLTLALGVVHGLVQNTNRTLQTIQVSATFVLVVAMLFLQLGQQERNTNIYLQLYLAHRNLIQELKSAIANQDLPILSRESRQANQTALDALPKLTDSGKVALLIRRIDLQLQSLPPIPIDLNDSTVKSIYGWLSIRVKQEISE